MPVSFSIADSSNGPRKVVIWVTGDLDADTARAVRARLAQAERHAQSSVILDLTHATIIDSAGVTAIVNGAKALGAAGHLRVISPPDRIADLLREEGMSDVFDLVPDRRDGDRRQHRVAVEFERRKGDRRRYPLEPLRP